MTPKEFNEVLFNMGFEYMSGRDSVTVICNDTLVMSLYIDHRYSVEYEEVLKHIRKNIQNMIDNDDI